MADKLPETEEGATPPEQQGHWQVVRDLLGFQFKLLLDALRDFALSPISIIAVIAGIATPGREPGYYYHRLMKLGRRTDEWINLFGQHNEDERETSDMYVSQMADLVKKEAEKGGIVGQLRTGADQLIERMNQEEQQEKSRKDRDSDW